MSFNLTINVYGGSPTIVINGSEALNMSLPDYLNYSQGSLTSWRDSGGDRTMDLTGLVNGDARMGQVMDFGSNWEEQAVRIVMAPNAAPTARLTFDLSFVFSNDNSVWGAGVSGSDGAWPADGNEDEWAVQIHRIGSLILTNDAAVQISRWIRMVPLARYGVPILDNNSGQSSSTTSANNRIDIMSYRLLIAD